MSRKFYNSFWAIFCLINVLYFYFYLVLSIGNELAAACEDDWRCSRLQRRTKFGYFVDLADHQWREFRQSLWILWLALIGVYILQLVVEFIFTTCGQKYTAKHKISVRLISAIVTLIIQHGWHSLIVISYCSIGFILVKTMHRNRYFPAIAWSYAIFMLLFKESYRLSHLPGLQCLLPLFDRRFGGMYGWQLPANFLVLRLLAFSFDLHWAFQRSEKSHGPTGEVVVSDKEKDRTANSESTTKEKKEDLSAEGKVQTITPLTEDADDSPPPMGDFSFVNFTAYMLYAPLYMAGPIISFNSFLRFTHTPQREINVFFYAGRWAACMLLMEFLTNRFPVFSIIQAGLIPMLSAGEVAVLLYITLKIMWVKFLLIWRFFRLWALTDGVHTPENMQRCMSNNYSLGQFWRGWHCSFHRWLMRYLYLPLGGRAQQWWVVWVVFLFVALWHDFEGKLLLWGLLNSLFYLLESVGKKAVLRSKFFTSLPFYIQDLFFSLSGAVYICVLILVNVLGYAVGVGGLREILDKLCSLEGGKVLLMSCYFLAIGVKVMMMLRQWEVVK